MTHRQPSNVDLRIADGRRLGVLHARRRHDDDPAAGHPGPPTEVEGLTEIGDIGRESGQILEEVGADQHGVGGHHEHVGDHVVLFLVEFTALHLGRLEAELVHRRAHADEVVGVAPLDQLGSHDAGVGPKGLADHGLDGVGLEADVVVEEEVEDTTFDGTQHLVGSLGEGGVAVHPPHESAGHVLGRPGSHVFETVRIDDEDRQVLIVLRRQALHEIVELRARVTGGNDGHHRGLPLGTGGVLTDSLAVVERGKVLEFGQCSGVCRRIFVGHADVES